MPPRDVPMKIARPMSRAVSTASTSASSTGEGIVLRLAVVVGAPAAARVDARRRAAACARRVDERGRELVEVRAVAREAGQAHDRQAASAARAVFAHVQPQAVLRGHEQAAKARVSSGRIFKRAARPCVQEYRDAPLRLAISSPCRRGAGPPRSSGASRRRTARDRPACSPARAGRSCASPRTGCARPSRSDRRRRRADRRSG